MKKFENFIKCFNVLKNSSIEKTREDEIYRMGVIRQFDLCSELAWKSVKEVLMLHGVKDAQTGSPREILKLGFGVGFVNDEKIWLDMLKKRNTAVHVYDEEKAEEIIELIYSDYIPAFERLADTLAEKIKEAEDDQ